MDPPRSGHFSSHSSAVWGIGFRHWVNALIFEMRRKSPVQQKATTPNDEDVNQKMSPEIVKDEEKTVVDTPRPKLVRSNASVVISDEYDCNENDNINISEVNNKSKAELNSSEDKTPKRSSRALLLRDRSTTSEGNSPRHHYSLFRDSSFQSEGGTSRCSSVESLLESRRVDAEAVLRGVGFGPSPSRQQLARIPDRFLKPSKVKGINTDQFIKEEQKSMKMHECGVFGYRGLTGNPHVPPSTIVAKIIERISSSEELPETYYIEAHHTDIDTF